MIPQIGFSNVEQFEPVEIPTQVHRQTFETIAGTIDGRSALLQTINNILMTERGAHDIYPEDYGVEFEQYIGADFSFLEATIENTLRAALLQDDRITDVSIVEITKIDNDKAEVNFEVTDVYGSFEMGLMLPKPEPQPIPPPPPPPEPEPTGTQPPKFTPHPNTIQHGTTHITLESPHTIFYRINAGLPNTFAEYKGEIVTIEETTTFYAFAFDENTNLFSDVVSARFEVQPHLLQPIDILDKGKSAINESVTHSTSRDLIMKITDKITVKGSTVTDDVKIYKEI